VTVPSAARLSAEHMKEVLESFHALHERMFTYCVRQSPADYFHWGVTGIGRTAGINAAEMLLEPSPAALALKAERQVLFDRTFVPTRCYDGDALRHGMTVEGPAVIEQENTTVVLFGRQRLRVNGFGDFVVSL